MNSGNLKMRLSDARRSKLLNQWALGRRLNYSQAKISMIERGQVSLSKNEKRRIAEILQMPVEAIAWPGNVDGQI